MDIFTAENFSEETLSALAAYVTAGGKQVCLAPGCPLGKPPFDLPDDVMVQDMRYGGVSFIRGNHPRLEGLWTQYSHLDTGLARNITFSQTITDRTPIENWQSKPHAMQAAPVGAMVSEEYRHAHNHYQLLHSEVYNFSRDLNGVAIWGDSAALAPNAKSWGAFFSARSWPLKWTGYTPPECFDYDDQTDFDAALVGVEIDVLNAGKDWCDFNGYTPPGTMGKVGLQVVGFGKRNTAAIEIRTEDSDDGSRSPSERRGTWHWGIIVRNALGHRSTVLMAENGEIFRGIDLDKTVCTDGALRISGAGPATGVIFDGGKSGEVFSTPADNALNIRIGAGGLKIWSADGSRVICIIDENGLWMGDRESSARH